MAAEVVGLTASTKGLASSMTGCESFRAQVMFKEAVRPLWCSKERFSVSIYRQCDAPGESLCLANLFRAV